LVATQLAFTDIRERRQIIDIWIPMRAETAERLVAVLRVFGFDVAQLSVELFLRPDQVIRLGNPPVRIELLTTISGVAFDECYGRAEETTLGGVVAVSSDRGDLDGEAIDRVVRGFSASLGAPALRTVIRR
jgi:hypothetical protein